MSLGINVTRNKWRITYFYPYLWILHQVWNWPKRKKLLFLDSILAPNLIKHPTSEAFWQRSVWPYPQSVTFDIVSITFDIVSRCFEKKTIIVEKQNLAKMPFVYYLQIYKSISDNTTAWTSWQQGCQIMDL